MGWLCGIIAMAVYLSTAERSAGWWDTGEFVASAYKLQIVHQPGAPLFLMLQNIFSNFAGGDVEQIAFWMNAGSAVCSGLTITFLFWTISALGRKCCGDAADRYTFPILLAATVGALAFSFTDTFWYSAVESEVYAMSSLCTAAVVWLALKWERRADQPGAVRWLLAIAYVMGLSIGVHLLNLLTVPAIALWVYFRKSSTINSRGIAKTLFIGMLVLALILWGVIQYALRGAAWIELLFVNQLGLPFGSGIGVFIMVVLLILIYGICHSHKRGKPMMNAFFLGLSLVFFGFSSYSLLPIRAQTAISLNNNAPTDIFSLLGYLSREQYQTEPLLKGPSFDADIIGVNKTTAYRQGDVTYEPFEQTSSYRYGKETLFPRLYSPNHAAFYQSYLDLRPGESPHFGHNLRFFFDYQVGHMYNRYFMWNFAGRQNHLQGHGDGMRGNWVSGLSSLDHQRIPGLNAYEQSFDAYSGSQHYFFIPLVFGLLGGLFQWKRNPRDLFVVACLFFFTGLAIVLYLNQTPMQPRERDYAYAGSFYVFAIWIGLGALWVCRGLRRIAISRGRFLPECVSLSLLTIPVLMLVQNWESHDRSDRKLPREMAINVLNSCEPNAILFTYADNDTFPLWYVQEVEGVRPDVRILNYGYLQSDWYVKQALQDQNASSALPLGFAYEKVKKGVRDGLPVMDFGIDGYSDVQDLLEVMLSDDPRNMVQDADGQFHNVLPNRKMALQVDKEQVKRYQQFPEEWNEHIVEQMQWEFPNEVVSRAELSVLSLLVHNNWKRPVYFTTMSSPRVFMGLDRYLSAEGLVYKLLPIAGQPDGEGSDLVDAERIYQNATKRFSWSSLAELSYLDTDSNTYFENWIYPDVYVTGLKALMERGEKEKAKELVFKALAFQPRHGGGMRQRYSNAWVVDTLLKVGERGDAIRLTKKEFDEVEKHLEYQLEVRHQGGQVDAQVVRLGGMTLDRYRGILPELSERELDAQYEHMLSRYRDAWL